MASIEKIVRKAIDQADRLGLAELDLEVSNLDERRYHEAINLLEQYGWTPVSVAEARFVWIIRAERGSAGDVAEESSPAADLAAQLERIAGLHRSGALSDDEFAAAKAKLLG